MNTWEADGIADKLTHSWPHSNITATAWVDELTNLDRARAEEACRQLVRNSERAPSIAQFLAAYRNLAGTAPDDRVCPECANTGWVPDDRHPQHWPGVPENMPPVPEWYGPADGCLCNVNRSCKCEHGEKVRRQHRPDLRAV